MICYEIKFFRLDMLQELIFLATMSIILGEHSELLSNLTKISLQETLFTDMVKFSTGKN